MIIDSQIMKVHFNAMPSSYSELNIANLRNILEYYFELCDNFFVNRDLLEETLLQYLNEQMFFKFTNFFFE